ncbi:MAG: 5'/3'-nucleotidase SurE [Bacteroidaceae bacterium]
MKPLFLISNDDGVTAKGLNHLIRVLRPIADLFVMAPDRPRSAVSCSITSTIPIGHKIMHVEEGLTICSCTGTPTDCIKLALDQLLMKRPDLVIGGINHGDNSSINTHYSGTMGVAMEGALQGLPSVAFSLSDHNPDADFSATDDYIVRIVQAILDKGIPFYTCLNVNFPLTRELKGIKICRMAIGRWQDEYAPCEHPLGKHFYWLAGECVNDEPDEADTDLWALENGYVAITPTQVDVTSYALLNTLKDWDL